MRLQGLARHHGRRPRQSGRGRGGREGVRRGGAPKGAVGEPSQLSPLSERALWRRPDTAGGRVGEGALRKVGGGAVPNCCKPWGGFRQRLIGLPGGVGAGGDCWGPLQLYSRLPASGTARPLCQVQVGPKFRRLRGPRERRQPSLPLPGRADHGATARSSKASKGSNKVLVLPARSQASRAGGARRHTGASGRGLHAKPLR